MKTINDTSLLWYESAYFEFLYFECLYFWLVDVFDTINNLPRFSVSVSKVSPYIYSILNKKKPIKSQLDTPAKNIVAGSVWFSE